ncbi:MAG: hypothetical protein MJB14_15280 [Spirochaetes bacterium]|nr:hypothetical protein [Spirochaetota bacterium]
MKIYQIIMLSIILVILTGCFPYVYHDQSEVLIEGIDYDATLEIAKIELQEGGWDSILTIWVIRDQIITVETARQINDIYLKYIDRVFRQKNKVARNFGAWHLAWAIANLYRNNNDQIKAVLEKSYQNALTWPDKLETFNKIAQEHIRGEKIYMGDIHDGGLFYAQTHIVVPGNKDYIQSVEHFIAAKDRDFWGYKRMRKFRKQLETFAE